MKVKFGFKKSPLLQQISDCCKATSTSTIIFATTESIIEI